MKDLYTAILRYIGLFVTFPITHLRLVEARGIEPLSEKAFMQPSTSLDYLLKFPEQTADKRAESKGSPDTIQRYGHTDGSFTTDRRPTNSRGTL